MKRAILPIIIVAAAFTACKDDNARYLDLNTGERIEVKDSAGIMINVATGQPVDLYIDTKSNDTIYGRTNKVVNGSIRRNNSGTWVYINPDNDYNNNVDPDQGTKVKVEDGETKIKSGDYKKEVEKDGDITIKDGNTKIKIDGKTGERKVKKDD